MLATKTPNANLFGQTPQGILLGSANLDGVPSGPSSTLSGIYAGKGEAAPGGSSWVSFGGSDQSASPAARMAMASIGSQPARVRKPVQSPISDVKMMRGKEGYVDPQKPEEDAVLLAAQRMARASSQSTEPMRPSGKSQQRSIAQSLASL